LEIPNFLALTWEGAKAFLQDLWAIDEFRLIFWALVGLVAFVVISYLLMRRSRDRCIKDFESFHVTALLPDEDEEGRKASYSGILEVPVRAGNGFEIHYDPEGIENLPQLLSYMRTAEFYTHNPKYSKAIDAMKRRLSEVGKDGLDAEYDLNPFDMPPEASRKVYKEDLEKLFAIVRMVDDLTEIEARARMAALESFFHPSWRRRASRALGNFFSFAWDRVKEVINLLTSYFTKSSTAEIKKLATETQTKAFTYTPRSYEALLENSIGYLVKVKVVSPDGKERFYRGVLREYSTNFLCLYNVFFRLPRAAEYDGSTFLGLDPKVLLKAHGKPPARDQDLEVSVKGDTITLRNISRHHLKLDKILVDGQEIDGPTGLMPPGSTKSLRSTSGGRIRIEYEEAFPADVVLPRRLAMIVGKAEPRAMRMEKLRKLAGQVKHVPLPDVKNVQSKFFTIKKLDIISGVSTEGESKDEH